MAGIGFNCGSLLSVKAMYFLQYSYMNEQLMFLVYYKEMSSKEINSKIDNYIKIKKFYLNDKFILIFFSFLKENFLHKVFLSFCIT